MIFNGCMCLFNPKWLCYRNTVCEDYLTANPSQLDIFTASSLAEMIINVLECGGMEQNQEDLLNLLGEAGIEFVFEILQHRDALLSLPTPSNDPLQPSPAQTQGNQLQEYEDAFQQSLSQRPIDDLGLEPEYLQQLKKQGLRIPNEPQGWKSQYSTYMPGVKLDHSYTSNDRISGQKKYYNVGDFFKIL